MRATVGTVVSSILVLGFAAIGMAQPESPVLILNDFLEAAPLPTGYQLSRRDIASDGRLIGRSLAVSCDDEVSKVIVHIELADRSQLAARRAALKGYVNGFAQSQAKAGYRVAEQSLPDINDDAVFQSPVTINMSFANSAGQKRWTCQHIFFDELGFHVQVVADAPDRFAALCEWAESVRLKGSPPVRPKPLPKPEPKPPILVAKPIDLLAKCDPGVHARHGRAAKANGALVTDSMEAPSQIAIPFAFPERYEIAADLTRLNGDGPAFIGLVVQGKACMAVIDGWPDDGSFTGVTLIDRKSAEHPDYPAAAHRGPLLQNNQPAKILCRVDGPKITITVHGREVFQWSDSPARLSLSQFFRIPDQTLPFLGSARSRYRFQRVELHAL